MRTKSFTRRKLIKALHQTLGLPYRDSAVHVRLVLKEITDCLERGEEVKLTTFGTFLVRQRGSRPGRNPKTGEPALITPRRVIVFKPSAILKRHLTKADHQKMARSESAALESG
jgi:integration host factor subunit alpha